MPNTADEEAKPLVKILTIIACLMYTCTIVLEIGRAHV